MQVRFVRHPAVLSTTWLCGNPVQNRCGNPCPESGKDDQKAGRGPSTLEFAPTTTCEFSVKDLWIFHNLQFPISKFSKKFLPPPVAKDLLSDGNLELSI